MSKTIALIKRAGRLLRVLSGFIACAGIPSLSSTGQVITNDVFWKDLAGNPIYSQGGGVLQVGDTWYWYGAKYTGAVTYYNNPTRKNSDVTFSSVTCYSSTDLVNWKFEGDVLTNQSGWVGRLGVAYNEPTKKYVLVSQGGGGILFATSATPSGKFTFDHVQTAPPGIANGATGDQTVFTDDDGKAYLICSSASGRSNLYVAPLRASDFLNVEQATRIFGGAGREGNCLFKYRSRYYFCSSDLHGWNSSHCYYISATNIMGPYSAEEIMGNSALDFCHVTQTGFFITVNGCVDTTVLFCGDRWSDFAGNGIGYNQWCPLSFDGIAPVFNSLSQFTLDAAAGTWKVGSGNNFVLNPSFEADRVSQTTLAGWTNSPSGAGPSGNASGAHTGNFCMQQTSTAAYTASMFQDITGIPDGTYTLKAWVQSSGGQTACRIFAKNFGGTEKDYSINRAISSWTQITISDIVITSGKCQVGISSDAKANNWCKVDDLSLINSYPDGVARSMPARRTRRNDDAFTIVYNGQTSVLPDDLDGAMKTAMIFDFSGRLLRTISLENGQVRLADFGVPWGVYLARVIGR